MKNGILKIVLAAGTVLAGVVHANAEVFPATPTIHATVGDTVEYVFTADDPGTEFIVFGGQTATPDSTYYENPGVLSGILTQAGTFHFTVYAHDAFNMTLSEREYTLIVAPEAVAKPVGRDVSFDVDAGSSVTIPTSSLIDSIDGNFEFVWFPDQPSNGFLSTVGNNVVYEPNPGFSGSDSFTFVIVASKESGGSTEYVESDPRTVTLTVKAAEAPETPTPAACHMPAGQTSKFVFRSRNTGVLPC